MDEVLSAFLGECHENLEKLDNEMVQLEKDPKGPHTQGNLAKIFRTVHTIKGSCGWLGLQKLESVVHDGEDLLVCLREGRLLISTEIVNTLLEMFDAIREILHKIETQGNEGERDYSSLIQRLKLLQSVNYSSMPSEPETHSPQQPVSDPDDEEQELDEAESAPTFLSHQPQSHSTPVTETKPSRVVKQTSQASKQSSDNSAVANSSIRVDVKLLDRLMNLVGELVLARNQMLQFTNTLEDAAFITTCQRLNLITTELQEGVMKTRMQTIGTIWNKFPRVVRDLALECGKEVMLEMEGEGTELDRTIVEAIKDPLTHLVRNSIDHGFESPQERVAQGKHPKGKLLLKAYHEGGHVNISITDDGRGMNPDRIREKAIQKGMITSSEAAQMNDRSLLNLIFLPGFSTAEEVTNISGRGVGMDVVKNNIEKIGGLIDLYSELGEGTTFKIKIPLTLAIIPALMVTSHGDRYAIPQVSLLELVSLEGQQAREGIEMIYNTPVYRLRGNLLPLIYLNEELGLESFKKNLEALQNPDNDDELILKIVVLQADEHQFGLVVDEINDTEEIVVKPLSKQLKSLSVYAGATIMGDGKVALILDVMGFAQKAQVVSETKKRKLTAMLDKDQEHREETQSLLLFQAGEAGKMAIPLSLVARLEEFEKSRIEYSGDLKVIQYRGQILPLVYLSEVLPRLKRMAGSHVEQNSESLHVIVYTENEHSIGLVVERILDILEADQSLEVQHSARREGVLGSIVLQGIVTELLDLRDIVQRKIPAFFDSQSRAKQLARLR